MAQKADIHAALSHAINQSCSVAPREVAISLAEEGQDWRRLLPAIRRVATEMAAEGELVFIRKKKIHDPATVKGVFRYQSTAKVSHEDTSDG